MSDSPSRDSRPVSRWRTALSGLLSLVGVSAAVLLPVAQSQAAAVAFAMGATRADQNGNTLQLH
ncbi:glycoside hydrolase, partial [Kitasatospora sp. NPDC056531]